jgi:hypothetical protein
MDWPKSKSNLSTLMMEPKEVTDFYNHAPDDIELLLKLVEIYETALDKIMKSDGETSDIIDAFEALERGEEMV